MIARFLQHTPVWVWLLFLALIYLGFVQSRTRSVPRIRLFALPAAMLGLSLYGLFATFGAIPLGLLAWLAGGMLALRLHRGRGQRAPASYSPERRRYTVHGSWVPLGLMMAIFVARYAVAASVAIVPSLRHASEFVAAAGLAYGFLSFAFLARARAVLRVANIPDSRLAGQGA